MILRPECRKRRPFLAFQGTRPGREFARNIAFRDRVRRSGTQSRTVNGMNTTAEAIKQLLCVPAEDWSDWLAERGFSERERQFIAELLLAAPPPPLSTDGRALRLADVAQKLLSVA